MSSLRTSAIPFVISVGLCLPGSWGATGSRPARDALASPSVVGSTLVLSPHADYAHGVLRVVGPGDLSVRSPGRNGEPLSVELVAAGAALPDGRYAYELRLAAFDDAAEQVQAGSFRVEGGNLIFGPQGLDSGRSDSGLTSIGEQAVTDDQLAIHDQAADNVTFVKIENASFDDWVLMNQAGEFSLGTVDETRLVLRPDQIGVGVGTTSPATELHVVGELTSNSLGSSRIPEIRFETFADPLLGPPVYRDWDVGASSSSFWVEDVDAGTFPLRIAAGAATDTLRIASGEVGIAGDLHLPHGEVTTDGLRLTSSRETKEGFVPVDVEEVLARLREVPITEWFFKDHPGVRHLGPVAEDFHAAFSLEGHDPHRLEVTDVHGVTMAAIQALSLQLEAARAENAALLQRVVALEEALSAAPRGQ